MSEFLKGNFKPKNEIVESSKGKDSNEQSDFKEKYEKAAMASIGGSMVFVKKTEMTWDGDEEN